jgi:glycosyltransferase involved in cell wall biosynthesis
MLCQPDADHIAGTVLQLASSPLLRRHLGASAVRAAQDRSWERALEQLAGGYRRVLAAAPAVAGHAPARAA